MSSLPRFSIVICTDGRAAALRNTLESLQFLDYPHYEVCVVYGPTRDGTDRVLADFEGRIRTAHNPERNLSISRNIGIAMSAGDIVAFIDDDGLAEPEWLRDLEVAFRDPQVGGAGGVVYDHTGTVPQYAYSTANRLGRADWARTTPALAYNFPYTYNFPYVQGTNGAFRRSALLAINGFDEEFEFYLDETDVCCRMIDAGYDIRQLPNALVHHKFLPSEIRLENKITRHRYSVIKNKLYFSIVNNHGHDSFDTVIADAKAFIMEHAHDIEFHIEQKNLDHADLKTYWLDVDRAWRVGLAQGLSGRRRFMTAEMVARFRGEYLEYSRPVPASGRRVYCFVSGEYPPNSPGGVGRYVHQLARSVARVGHHVHVLTKSETHDRVDFEDGVWVHRLVPKSAAGGPDALAVPPHIWNHAATMSDAVEAIDRKRAVTAVCAPSWDCEGIALIEARRFVVCTLLVTMLKSWLESHPHVAADAQFVRSFATPMLALERRMLAESAGIVAPSIAIVDQVRDGYGVTIDPERLAVVPLGLDDWSVMPDVLPEPLPPGALRLLFVGRLEGRKGIDVLLKAAIPVLTRHPEAWLDLVGNDAIAGPNGITWRQAFEADPAADDVRDRVRFHGPVGERELRGFYRACDVFVAPSRFESFGLILVEAMMYGKAILACRAGGMVEVVEHGESGWLAAPGDGASLQDGLERLVADAGLRRRLGSAARGRYEAHFTPDRMATAVLDFLTYLGDRRPVEVALR